MFGNTLKVILKWKGMVKEGDKGIIIVPSTLVVW